MIQYLILFPILLTLLPALVWASPPVPFSGKVSIDGINYHGPAKFSFAIRDKNGTVHWRNGATANDAIHENVANGRYVVLLGGQGMHPLPASLFANHDELYVRVAFDKNDGQGLRHLVPDQRITAVPYALSAETAKTAKSADMVKPGAVTTAQLNEQILKYLKPEITLAPQAPGLIFGGQTITLNSRAEGKFLTYQWHKNGQPIAGAIEDRYVIQGVNGSEHEGNYTLVVRNDFGSVTTQPTSVVVGVPGNYTVASIGMEMNLCLPGTFLMGGADYNVTLTNGFYLGKYELTQAQYEAVMNGNPEGLNATPSKFSGNNRPVEQVSWNNAQVFLSRLNQMEQTAGHLPVGWKYVLPTEAEWEYACSAGTNTVYSWGDSINSNLANYNLDLNETSIVGQYSANPWGFHDMHGNIWEWVGDWYGPAVAVSKSDPEGPSIGTAKIRRGGSWKNLGKHARSTIRFSNSPNMTSDNFGFRVAFKAIQPDTANPEFSLSGGASISHSTGIPFVDPGYEAHDVRDGSLTNSVTTTGAVDVNSTGTYVLIYSVTDAAGNQASATRTVTVTGARSVDLNASVAMDMLWVPAGTFTMGSPTSETGRDADRETEHNVTLTNGFYLGKYEVTQAQYEAVMTGNTNGLNAKPSEWPNNPNRPVEKVSWDDAQVFLTRLNAAEQAAGRLSAGWSYVLPTESQWEYASRAGTTTAYSLGATITSSNANYDWDGAWNTGSDFKQTRDVGQYAANPWGFYDMHGNVWEWTADRYQAAYPSGNPVIDPTGPVSGSDRVKRGGSWHNTEIYLRSAKRNYDPPSHRRNQLGFRVGFQKQ